MKNSEIPPLIMRIVLKCCQLNLARLLVCKRWYYHILQYFADTIREFIMRVKRIEEKSHYVIYRLPNYRCVNCNEHFIFEGHAPDEEWGIFQNDELREKFHERGRKFCSLSVANLPSLFKFLPDHLKTAKMCSKVKKNFPSLVEYIPENQLNCDDCLEIVRNHGLKFFPEKYITEEICEIAITNNGLDIQYIPTYILTLDLRKKALEQNYQSYQYFPAEWKTKRLKEIAVECFFIYCESYKSSYDDSSQWCHDKPLFPRYLM